VAGGVDRNRGAFFEVGDFGIIPFELALPHRRRDIKDYVQIRFLCWGEKIKIINCFT